MRTASWDLVGKSARLSARMLRLFTCSALAPQLSGCPQTDSQVRHFEMRHILTNHALYPNLGQIGSPCPLTFWAAEPIAAPGKCPWLASASWQSAAQSLHDRTSYVASTNDASTHRPSSCVVKLRFINMQAAFMTTNAALSGSNIVARCRQ
jgi:hypothetical protein